MELKDLFEKTSWSFGRCKLKFNLEELTNEEFSEFYDELKEMGVIT